MNEKAKTMSESSPKKKDVRPKSPEKVKK